MTDLITLTLALTYGALKVILEGLIAAGALLAQLLDMATKAPSPEPHPVPCRTEAPTAPPVLATSTASITRPPTVAQLRQQCRALAAPQWWTLNRNQCLMVLAVGGVA